MNFQKALKTFLKSQGLNIEYLANKINCTKANVYAKHSPSINFIRDVCEVLNCYVITDGTNYQLIEKN
jgi:hypothetical protein